MGGRCVAASRRQRSRVLVVQIGARRRYAVPRGLAAIGSLHVLFTDACASTSPWSVLDRALPEIVRPATLSAVLNRKIAGVESTRVKGNLRFFLATKVGPLRRRPDEPGSTYWARQNEAFGSAVAASDWGGADSVYAYNGAALEVFERARRTNMRCILDQTAAPWRFNSELLDKELKRWPDWESAPSDLDSDGAMIAREEAEWKLADRIICGSQFVVEAVRAVGGPVHKCAVVEYPVPEVDVVTVNTREASHRALRVLFLGTLQLRKGIQYFWEAAGRLDASCEFRAVGPSNLTKAAQELVQSRIDWRPNVARTDVWEHYRWADVFVLPTLSEGSANACWEALACGTSVATTQASGLDKRLVDLIEPGSEAVVDYLLQYRAGPRRPVAPLRIRRSVKDYGSALARAMAWA